VLFGKWLVAGGRNGFDALPSVRVLSDIVNLTPATSPLIVSGRSRESDRIRSHTAKAVAASVRYHTDVTAHMSDKARSIGCLQLQARYEHKDTDMNANAKKPKLQTWLVPLALAGVLFGCGGGGDGGNGPNPQADAVTNISVAVANAGRTLTVPVGAGAGADGMGLGPSPVKLMSISTENFAILTQTGITNTGSHLTRITGNIGSSPITGAAIGNVFCTELVGTIYGVDAAYTGSGDTSCYLGGGVNKTLVDNAVLDLGTALTDAASRAPDYTELGSGAIGGMTLPPGVYKWGTGVTILTDVFLVGGPNDVWIFQVSGDITMASAKNVTLLGGALARNIFWQAAGPTGVVIGTTAHFEGTILASKAITVNTGASANGRFLSQTAVTLDANTVVAPAQ